MTKTFDDLLAKVAACSMKKVAVAVAQDDAVLEAVAEAKKRQEDVPQRVEALRRSWC